MRPLITFLACCSLLPAFALAKPQEVRMKLEHLRPSRAAERLELLKGGKHLPTARFEAIADDKSGTLTIRIPDAAGKALDQERVRVLVEDTVAKMDHEGQEVALFLYVLQPALLSDDEFRDLDSKLRTGVPDLPAGSTPKGVVYWNRFDAKDQEILPIRDRQGRMSGQSTSGAVSLKGRIFPAFRGPDTITVSVELELSTAQGKLTDKDKSISLVGRSGAADDEPLVMVAGQARPVGGNEFPMRHELMIYLWAKPGASMPSNSAAR